MGNDGQGTRQAAAKRWQRFVNWLEAEPWRWNYIRIWQSIQGEPLWYYRFWWTVSFPHVHHEDEVDVFDLVDWLMSDDRELEGIPLEWRRVVAGSIKLHYTR